MLPAYMPAIALLAVYATTTTTVQAASTSTRLLWILLWQGAAFWLTATAYAVGDALRHRRQQQSSSSSMQPTPQPQCSWWRFVPMVLINQCIYALWMWGVVGHWILMHDGSNSNNSGSEQTTDAAFVTILHRLVCRASARFFSGLVPYDLDRPFFFPHQQWLPTMPALLWLLLQTAAFLATVSAAFEALHTLLHRVAWLRPFHDLHHWTRGQCAVTAMFMHPIDNFMETVLPMTAPFLLLPWLPPMSTAAVAAGMWIVAVHGCITHSGHSGWRALWCDTSTHLRHHQVCYTGDLPDSGATLAYANSIAPPPDTTVCCATAEPARQQQQQHQYWLRSSSRSEPVGEGRRRVQVNTHRNRVHCISPRRQQQQPQPPLAAATSDDDDVGLRITFTTTAAAADGGGSSFSQQMRRIVQQYRRIE